MLERMWNNCNSNIFKVGVRDTIKDIYAKPTANIIFKEEKLKDFPLRSRIRHESPFSLLLFSIVPEVLARAILGKKKNKKHPN